MEWIDLTQTVSADIPTWDDTKQFEKNITSSISSGDVCNESQLFIGSHTGTHIDAPYHFNNNGKRIHELDVDILVGKCFIAEIYGEKRISGELLEKYVPEGVLRLIIKTDNTKIGYGKPFRKDFCGLEPSAVDFIKKRDIRLLGVDYLSISCYDVTKAVHTAFFEDNRRICVEGLVLNDVSRGWYDICCLPLKTKDADGAPARVVARRKTERN